VKKCIAIGDLVTTAYYDVLYYKDCSNFQLGKLGIIIEINSRNIASIYGPLGDGHKMHLVKLHVNQLKKIGVV
jgi:hypothetical protein